MNTYAVIDGSNVVVNMVIADTLADAELATGMLCVFLNICQIGYLYDPATGLFSKS